MTSAHTASSPSAGGARGEGDHEPDEARPTPRWPAWTAPVALVAGLVGGVILAVILGIVIGLTGLRVTSGAAAVASTVIQNLALLAAAVGFAWITARPWPRDFGLRGVRLRPALGWAAGALALFLGVELAVNAAFGVEGSPTRRILDQLGLGGGAGAFVGLALMICVVAPLFEELFFRGFFFSALRSRMNVWWAAILGGLAFGVIHIVNVLVGIPVEAAIAGVVSLSIFGAILCLLYWRTGSLYPCIGAHAVNNVLAFAVAAQLSVLGGLALMAGTAVVLAAILLAVRPLRPRVQAAAPAA